MVWAVRKISDILKLEYGKPLPKEDRDNEGNYPAYGANGVKNRTNRYLCDERGIVVGRKGSAGEVNLTEEKYWPLDVTYYLTFDRTQYDLMFLFYCLQSLNLTSLAKGVKPGINRNDVYALEISVPPLSEQKRIVAILDEAFAGIDAAIENTKRNLANARELFDSYLNNVFTQKGEGWVETRVGEQITLQRGFDITKKQQVAGNIPVVSSGGSKSFHNIAKVEAPGVVIGRKGSLGTAYFLEENFWPHDTTLWVKDFKGNDPKLVYYFFKNLDVSTLDSGTANPALNRNIVHPILTNWPEKKIQKNVVAKLDLLHRESQNIEEIYQQKLDLLTELKQSILQKAFSVELTQEEVAA